MDCSQSMVEGMSVREAKRHVKVWLMAFQMENLSTGQRRVDIQYYFAEGRKPSEINLSGPRLKKSRS